MVGVGNEVTGLLEEAFESCIDAGLRLGSGNTELETPAKGLFFDEVELIRGEVTDMLVYGVGEEVMKVSVV